MPIQVMTDRESKMLFTNVVPRKGSYPNASKRTVGNIELLGYRKLYSKVTMSRHCLQQDVAPQEKERATVRELEHELDTKARLGYVGIVVTQPEIVCSSGSAGKGNRSWTIK